MKDKDIIEKLNEIAFETNWGTVERVNGVPKLLAVIQEAVEEIKKLREEKNDLRLYEMQMRNGEIDMTFGSENASTFIYSILQMFKQNGGQNFVTTTIEVDGKELEGRYALTIQKVGGLTPIEKASNDTAKDILQTLHYEIDREKEASIICDEFNYALEVALGKVEYIAEKYEVEIDEYE